ncbi:MAG: hypothetical protein Q9167_006311 [Letrouitia subvulpina]
MSPISITFATATNPAFQWLDSFEDLGVNEIEEFILLLCGALATFYAELADRLEPCNNRRTEYSYGEDVQYNLHEIHIKIEPPLIKSCKKRRRKRDDSEDAVINRKIEHSRRKPTWSVTFKPSPNTFFENSNQLSFHKPALTPEPVERDDQPAKLTFDSEEDPPLPSADLGHIEVFRINNLVPSAGHPGSSTQVDTHTNSALSLEANFNRNSIPICQRLYDSLIFMRVLEGDIHGVYDILIRCEDSLWDYDPYGLGILYLTIAGEVLEKNKPWLCIMLSWNQAYRTMTSPVELMRLESE